MADEPRAVLIGPKGIEIVLTEDGWRSDNGKLSIFLNDTYPFPPEDQFYYDPNPMATTAKRVAKELGFEVRELPEPGPRQAGAIY